MTVSDAVCKNNPSEGVSSMPVAGLAGEAAPRTAPAGAKPTTPAVKEEGSLYIGELRALAIGELTSRNPAAAAAAMTSTTKRAKMTNFGPRQKLPLAPTPQFRN